MISLCGSGSRLCDGVTRREFLRVGGLGVAGLSWPDLLRLRAQAATARTKVKSCIRLFMWGGPSQQETFDPKPNAPDGIRGDFKPIATNVAGIRICEHLPMLARMADRYAILRSLTHTGVNHGTSAYHLLTGHIHFTPGTLRHPTPDDFPSIGCAAARFGRQPRDVPSYVALPSVLHDGDGGEVPGQGPGLLGQRTTPFLVDGDPTRPDFNIDTLMLGNEIDGARFAARMKLQSALDRAEKSLAQSTEAAARDS